MIFDNYTFNEHVHHFGVWTAARAASKSGLKNCEVELLIKDIGLREGVEYLRNQVSLNDEVYRDWIKSNGNKLVERVRENGATDFKKQQISFGLAAKVISIYIKTVEVLPTAGHSELSQIAYPPIDRYLLRMFNKVHNSKLNTTWSKFMWEEYVEVIDVIKSKYPTTPMWKIEVLWNINNLTNK